MPYFGTQNLNLVQINPRWAGYVLVPEAAIKIATGARPAFEIEGERIENPALYTMRDGKIYAQESFNANSCLSETAWKDFDAGKFGLKVDGKWLGRSTEIPSLPSEAFLAAQQKYHFSHYSHLIRRPLETIVNHALLYANAVDGGGIDIPITIVTHSYFSFTEINGTKWAIVTERDIHIKARFSGEHKQIPGEVISCYEVTEQGYVFQGMYADPEMKIEELIADPETYIGHHYSRIVATNIRPMQAGDDFLAINKDDTLSRDLWSKKLPGLLTSNQNGLEALKQEQPSIADICIDNKHFNSNMREAFNQHIAQPAVTQNFTIAFTHYHFAVGHPIASLICTAMQGNPWQFSSAIKSLSFKRKGYERYLIVVEHELKFTNNGIEIPLDKAEVKTLYSFENNTYQCMAMCTTDNRIANILQDPMRYVDNYQAKQQMQLQDKESQFSSLVLLVNHQQYVQEISSIPSLNWIPFPEGDISRLGMDVQPCVYDTHGTLIHPQRAILDRAQKPGKKLNLSSLEENVRNAIDEQEFNPFAQACANQGLVVEHAPVFIVYRDHDKHYVLVHHNYTAQNKKITGTLITLSEFDTKENKFYAHGIYASNLSLQLKILYGLDDYKAWPTHMLQIQPSALVAGIPETQQQITVTRQNQAYLKITRSKPDATCEQIKKDFDRAFICADDKFLDSYYVSTDFWALAEKYGWSTFEQSFGSIVGAGYFFVRLLQLKNIEGMHVSINRESSKILFFEEAGKSYFVNAEFLAISYELGGRSYDLTGFIYTRCVKEANGDIYRIEGVFASNQDLVDILDYAAKALTGEEFFLFATQKIPLAKIAYLQDKIRDLPNPPDNLIWVGLQILFAELIQNLSNFDKKKNHKQIMAIANSILKLSILLDDPIKNCGSIIKELEFINLKLSECKIETSTHTPGSNLSHHAQTQQSQYRTASSHAALKAFALFVVGSILILAGLYIAAQTLGTGTLFGLGLAHLGFSVMGVSVPGAAVFAVGMSVATGVTVIATAGGCAVLVGAGQTANKSLHAYEAYTKQCPITEAAVTVENSVHGLKPRL